MPVNIMIIHASDFIRVNVDGALDRFASGQALADIAWMIKTPGENHVLIDTRDARVKQLSPDDLFELGVAFNRFPSLAKSKIALLTAMGGAHAAQFLELVGQSRGAHLKAFTSMDEAITWLRTKEQQGD